MAWLIESFMKSFKEIWQLLNPQGEFKRRRGACERLWQGYEPARQDAVYAIIEGKLLRGEFVNENPYFAIEDNARQKKHRQIMSFAEYYKIHKTTEEVDGWHMENPTGEKVIYVKG